MILSVHIADVGARAARSLIRSRLSPSRAPGLVYGETMTAVLLSARFMPRPEVGRAGLIAAWRDDEAFERFLAEDPLAQQLAHGWHVRLEPLRASGSWSKLPGLPARPNPVDPQEPVAVLTLGRLRLHRVIPFLRASARAEGAALADPALLAASGLGRPPRIVSTFSLWRTAAAMQAYAYGDRAAGHPRAIRGHREHPFHHESLFARFRPYAAEGTWDGRDPLAGLVRAEPTEPVTTPA
jgi:hypothetical protein